MKKIFLFMFLMVIFMTYVNAEACDAYDIKRLKEIAKGVEITYEKLGPYGNNQLVKYDDYRIKIVGLTDEIYVYDKLNDKLIYFSATDNGNVEYTSFSNGINYFYIYSKSCYDKLVTQKIPLPIYNYYHDSEECKKIDYSISFCDEYIDRRFTNEEFVKSYNLYLENNSDNDFSIKYLFFVLGAIVFIALIFIILKIKKRRNELV